MFGMRSRLGLHGNTLNVDPPAWERQDSGTGAGIDSFYEYLLKVRSASCSAVLSPSRQALLGELLFLCRADLVQA